MSDYAITAEGDVVTIEETRTMVALPALFCDGIAADELPCAAPVRARALASEVQRPHFYGRHRPGCSHGSQPSQSLPGDAGHVVARPVPAPLWTVIREDRASSVGPEGRRRPDDRVAGTGTRRAVPDRREGVSTAPHRRHPVALLRHVRSGASLDGITVEVAPGVRRPATEVILHISAATRARREDQVTWVWGEITDSRPTRFGGLMCKFRDAAEDLAVLLTQEQLHRFPAADAASVIGRHILGIGGFADTGRGPYLKIGSHRDMAFLPLFRQRRREASAQAGG